MQEEKLSTPDHPKPQHLHHFPALFHHTIIPYQPRNVNKVHEEEKAAEGINTAIAIGLTKRVGTMWTAYTFAVLAVIGLFAILNLLTPIVALLVAWASQTQPSEDAIYMQIGSFPFHPSS